MLPVAAGAHTDSVLACGSIPAYNGRCRLSLFLDIEDVDAVTIAQLTSLGVGQKYTIGIFHSANSSFTEESDSSL